MNLHTEFDLQAFNTLAIPSIAEYFCQCATRDETRQAILWANENEKALRILAGGSNVVLGDYLSGLTLMPNIKGISVRRESNSEVEVNVGAGENWHELVEYCTQAAYFGLENLALIPGSVGAAPIQNIGAYGAEVKDVIDSVEVIDRETLEQRVLDAEECQFAYRDSIFKHQAGENYIVTAVNFILSKQPKTNVTYPALAAFLSEGNLASTPDNVMRAVMQIRSAKLPDPTAIPNAGSFFKNPSICAERYAALLKKHTAIPSYPMPDGTVKVPAAWLIEQAGWKGKAHMGVSVHAEHALVLVNPERKNAQAVLALATEIRNAVADLFGIYLEQEPRTVS